MKSHPLERANEALGDLRVGRLAHQPGHALAAEPVPAVPKLGVHPRAAIALAVLSMNRLDLDAEPLVRLGPDRRGPLVPRVEARARHRQG